MRLPPSIKRFLTVNGRYVVGGVFLLIAASILFTLNQVSNNVLHLTVQQGTSMQAQLIREFRALYSDDVVQRLSHYGIRATHDYKVTDRTIPLPATLTIELGKAMHERYPDVEMRLYSDYPFPWRRAEGGVRDKFEHDALVFLRKHPNEIYYSFEDLKGTPYYRYAVGDVMKESCVQCHNTHPDSPKKDWKVGDVRGVLEIERPLNALVSQVQSSLVGTAAIMIGLAAAAFVAVQWALAVSMRAQRTAEETAARSATANVELAFGLDSVRSTIGEQSAEILGVTEALSSARHNILSSAMQLAGNAARTAVAVKETTAVVEGAMQAVEVTAGRSKSASGTAKDALQLAKSGQSATDGAVVGMRRIKEHMEELGKCMTQLNMQSAQIREIVYVIDEIAQQSNILGLNATIESVKAGEYGMGFGIVAKAIRDLSQESRRANHMIGVNLDAVVKAISVAAEAAQQSTEVVVPGEHQIKQAQEVILRALPQPGGIGTNGIGDRSLEQAAAVEHGADC